MARNDYARSQLSYLKIKGKTVAEKAGVTPSCVSHVLNGRGESRNVKQAVADLLGKPYEEVWGKAA